MVEAGYAVKSANLTMLADDPAALVKRAQRLQSEMLIWFKGAMTVGPVFDGRFATLLDTYETDPESTFRALKPGVARVYLIYLKRLRAHVGDIRIARTDGRAVKRWFAEWRLDEDGSDHLPRACTVLAVLKAAVSFGVVCRLTGCKDFQDVISELEFPKPKGRSFAPTAEEITAARKAAHAHAAPRRALLYALQYETTLRQWDILGQWVEMSDPRPSATLHKGMKWVGLSWKAIDDNLILSRLTPTKTEDTSGASVSFDLSVCPMVMEELAMIPRAERTGPLIINPNTGLPYKEQAMIDGWNKDAEAAGLPTGMWNRDLRAGGVTEGGKAGAKLDDRRKLAGHSNEETTQGYDRDMLEAHRRVMASRTQFRTKNAP